MVLIGTSFKFNNNTSSYIKNHVNEVKALLTNYVNSEIDNIAKSQTISPGTICRTLPNLQGCFLPGIIIWYPGSILHYPCSLPIRPHFEQDI
jgi:hypothetical protein